METEARQWRQVNSSINGCLAVPLSDCQAELGNSVTHARGEPTRYADGAPAGYGCTDGGLSASLTLRHHARAQRPARGRRRRKNLAGVEVPGSWQAPLRVSAETVRAETTRSLHRGLAEPDPRSGSPRQRRRFRWRRPTLPVPFLRVVSARVRMLRSRRPCDGARRRLGFR